MDVLLTPHSAAQTEEGLRTMAVTIAQEVTGVLRGNSPNHPVNDPLEVEQVRRKLGRVPLYGKAAQPADRTRA
jgi:phosphoglycerate dehydrogenase-like enzyme